MGDLWFMELSEAINEMFINVTEALLCKKLSHSMKVIMRLLSIVLVSVITLSVCVSVVSASMDWERSFGVGEHYNRAYSIAPSADGKYVVGGNTYSLDSHNYYSWLIKIDLFGKEEWHKEFSEFGNDLIFSVTNTSNQGYIAAGYTSLDSDTLENEVWLIKIDAQGNLQWNRTYGVAGNDKAFSVIQTSDGGYVFTGYTASLGDNFGDFWLVKVDAQGNLVWSKTYGGAGTEGAYCVIQAKDGGYAIAGQTNTFGNGANDAWLIKTDASGKIEWNQTYGGIADDGVYSLIQTSDGNYVAAGYSYNVQNNQYTAWLVKTDSLGNLVWQKTYAAKTDTHALSLVQAEDCGYVLIGYTDAHGSLNSQVWIVKIDKDGNMQSNRTFGKAGDDGGFAITTAKDGGYLIAGYVNTVNNTGSKVWVAKIYEVTNENLEGLPFELQLFGAGLLILTLIISIVLVLHRKKIIKQNS